jgi:hypothetical protein
MGGGPCIRMHITGEKGTKSVGTRTNKGEQKGEQMNIEKCETLYPCVFQGFL